MPNTTFTALAVIPSSFSTVDSITLVYSLSIKYLGSLTFLLYRVLTPTEESDHLQPSSSVHGLFTAASMPFWTAAILVYQHPFIVLSSFIHCLSCILYSICIHLHRSSVQETATLVPAVYPSPINLQTRTGQALYGRGQHT